MTNESIENLKRAKAEYAYAIESGHNAATPMERLKNLLFNYYDEIADMISENEKLRNLSKENVDLRKEIERFTAKEESDATEVEQKPTKSKKT